MVVLVLQGNSEDFQWSASLKKSKQSLKFLSESMIFNYTHLSVFLSSASGVDTK
jgi:hypothetical protein